jgi:hypothetical protein
VKSTDLNTIKIKRIQIKVGEHILDNINEMNYFSPNKPPGYYLHYLKLALRLYRGFFLNTLGQKHPYISGHKLTYNCNLRCKMCPF